MPHSTLLVKNLSKIYDEEYAVNSINFEINQGEIVGFLGPNGAGKSTTMKMITGITSPTYGEIYLNNQQCKEIGVEQKKYFGYLSETNPLFYDMYVMEFLGFIAKIRKLKEAKKQIDKYIDLLNFKPMAHKKIKSLSKGYKQRLGLATALLHEPDLLILDEPFSGLDPNQQIEMRSIVKRIGKQKSILFSSHILSEVQAIAERLIFIYQGKIVLDSSSDATLGKKISSSKVILKLQQQAITSDFDPIKSFCKNITIHPSKIVIHSDNIEQLKKEIIKLSLKNNWNILSLQHSNENLEQLFNQLTNNKV